MKRNRNSILEQIFYGEFFPNELIRSDDPDYLPTNKRIEDETKRLAGSLNDEEQKRLQSLVDLLTTVNDMDTCAGFSFGFRYGMLLMHELITGRESLPVFLTGARRSSD